MEPYGCRKGMDQETVVNKWSTAEYSKGERIARKRLPAQPLRSEQRTANSERRTGAGALHSEQRTANGEQGRGPYAANSERRTANRGGGPTQRTANSERLTGAGARTKARITTPQPGSHGYDAPPRSSRVLRSPSPSLSPVRRPLSAVRCSLFAIGCSPGY
jgi:hypothetical protein